MIDFAAVEFHDATLEAVNWYDSRITLVFSHIDVYFATGVDRYEVWSCRATLKLEEVKQLEIRGLIGSKDSISDGDLWDPSGQVIDPARLKNEQRVDKMELVFTNGAVISVRAARASFVDVSRTEQLENWIGPLRES